MPMPKNPISLRLCKKKRDEKNIQQLYWKS